MATPKQNAALTAFAKIAVPICREMDYPPEFLLAQWAAESSWGAKPSGENNVFGMTKASRHKGFQWVPTREVLTSQAIGRLDPDEQARITSQLRRPDGKWDVRLSRRFAAFDSVKSAIRDLIELIQTGPPYKKAWARYASTGALPVLIAEVAAVYATDPTYATLVKAIAGQSNVRKAVENA